MGAYVKVDADTGEVLLVSLGIPGRQLPASTARVTVHAVSDAEASDVNAKMTHQPLDRAGGIARRPVVTRLIDGTFTRSTEVVPEREGGS
ncbi:MAG: hypothetical protein ACHQ1G_00235 [Planctomycetota bacterium]